MNKHTVSKWYCVEIHLYGSQLSNTLPKLSI